jgi:FAD/FMN-containing dehydrogenase
MTATDPTRATLDLPALRDAVRGRVITPDDGDYDAARAIVYGGIEPRPAVIVRVADAEDVAAAIGFVRDHAMPFAVRSGGHSGAGHGSVDGGLVIDLRELSAIEVDPGTKTAWAGAGLTAVEVARAAHEHGLSIGFGDTGSVGIGGITTGGGVGYLVRKFGLTIDDLIGAEIVTADGRLRTVDAEHEPDLFWAIRGGGGNFGVVTRFHYRLHDLPTVTGGLLLLPATPETVAGFMAASAAAPEELSTIANVMPAPPMPMVPEEHHGTLAIMAIVCYAGTGEAAAAALAPLRSLATPLVDLVAEIPYPDIYPPDDPDYHPTAEARTMFVNRVDLATARTILEWLEKSDAPVRVAQLRQLGGAMARVPVDATAFAHRGSEIMVNVAAFYEGEADRLDKARWVQEFAGALLQDDRGAYVNFLVDEGEERIRAAYPHGAYERLAAIKARYDPTNLFRRNQNIPPARGETGDD